MAQVELGRDHLDALILEAKAARLVHAATPDETRGIDQLRGVVARMEAGMPSCVASTFSGVALPKTPKLP